MKIIYIHHSANLGGAPKSLSYLIEGVSNYLEKNIVTIYTPGRGAGTDFISLFSKNVFVDSRIIPFHNSVVSSTSFKKKLKGLYGVMLAPLFVLSLLKHKPDIIHLNSSCLFFYAPFIKLFSKKVKVICHLREPLLNNLISKIILLILNNYTDSLIAISNSEVPCVPLKNIHVISNPIYSAFQKPKNIFIENFNNKEITFTYMARCNYENGIFDFIEAARFFAGKIGFNMKFIIIGTDTSDDPAVLEAVQGISSLSTFPMTDNVYEHIKNSSCLIVPFKVPHFSRTLIEFGLAGVPAIVYNKDPINKIVKNNYNGFVCESSLSSLLILIENIIKNPYALESISKNVFDDFIDKYNSSNSIESVINIYRRLA